MNWSYSCNRKKENKHKKNALKISAKMGRLLNKFFRKELFFS